MNKGKGDLTRAERLEIGILLEKGYSRRSIANVLRRGKSTISYEIQNNSVNGIYDPLKADQKSRNRKHYRRFQYTKIEENQALKKHIIDKLKAHWNPDEIAGDMKKQKLPFYASKTAIYEWLRTSRGERYCIYLYSGRKRVKKRKTQAKRVIIPNRVDIAHRFAGADNRSRYRHYETDTIVGRRGTPGGIKSAYERKAKLVLARKVRSMSPMEHAHVERNVFSEVEALSLTRDNGIENRYHELLTSHT
jgi:transposase, IS30 family